MSHTDSKLRHYFNTIWQRHVCNNIQHDTTRHDTMMMMMMMITMVWYDVVETQGSAKRLPEPDMAWVALVYWQKFGVKCCQSLRSLCSLPRGEGGGAEYFVWPHSLWMPTSLSCRPLFAYLIRYRTKQRNTNVVAMNTWRFYVWRLVANEMITGATIYSLFGSCRMWCLIIIDVA